MAYDKAKALLIKLETGSCTPEEMAILEQWYVLLDKENPEVLSASITLQYREQFLHTFRKNQKQQQTETRVIPSGTRLQRTRKFSWAAAACLLLLAGTGYLWLRQSQTIPATTNIRTIANTTAHVKKIVLDDSSVVWLNAQASLSWNEASPQRHVTLHGEGYFEVRSDAQQPFIVDTRDMRLKVLGTSFNIEAYQAEKMTRVTLLSGSVQLHSKTDSSRQNILQPGQVATLAGADTFAITNTHTAAISNWTNGGFVVSNLSVKNAVTRLCERHGYTPQWQHTKDIHKTVSVSFTGESFEQSLGNLCYLIHKQYKLKGRQVIIY